MLRDQGDYKFNDDLMIQFRQKVGKKTHQVSLFKLDFEKFSQLMPPHLDLQKEWEKIVEAKKLWQKKVVFENIEYKVDQLYLTWYHGWYIRSFIVDQNKSHGEMHIENICCHNPIILSAINEDKVLAKF
jgi:hypothetical protein